MNRPAPNTVDTVQAPPGFTPLIAPPVNVDNFGTAIHERIRFDRSGYTEDPAEVAIFRKYVKGEHLVKLTARQMEILDGLANNGNKFSDNIAHEIVAAARDRIEFLGWTCEENKPVDTYLTDLYKKARVLARQSQVHYDAFRDGSTTVLPVWSPAKDQILLVREDWWDGHDGVFIAYGADDEPAYAVKEWHGFAEKDGKVQPCIRRIIWFDNRLERWISWNTGVDSPASSWVPYPLPEDKDVWPLPWLKADGKSPLHIPYVHFIDSGRGEINYGTSELGGGVIGFMDQLIDLQYGTQANGRQSAYQIITATGVTFGDEGEEGSEDSEDEDADTLITGSGFLLHSANKDARFGRIEAGDADGLLAIYANKQQRAAQMSRTPAHIITGDWPSGEAIMRAEQPAIGKARAQIASLRDSWVLLGHRAIEIYNAFNGKPQLEEDVKKAPIAATFADVTRRDLLAIATAIQQLGDTISEEEKLRMLGKSPSEIEQIIAEKDAAAQKAVERQQTLFSRGLAGGTGGVGPNTGEQPPKETVPAGNGRTPMPTAAMQSAMRQGGGGQ